MNGAQNGIVALYLRPGRLPPARATQLPDAVVIDLEEAVGDDPEEQNAARDGLSTMVAALSSYTPSIVVRIHSPTTLPGSADLDAVARLSSRVGLLIAKPVCLRTLDFAASRAGFRDLWCMGEEPGVEVQLAGIAAALPAFKCVVIGSKDLCARLSVPHDPAHPALRQAANAIRAAAQAAGLHALDGVAMGDAEAVRKHAARALADGFDGVTAYRPRDVAAVRAGLVLSA